MKITDLQQSLVLFEKLSYHFFLTIMSNKSVIEMNEKFKYNISL